MGDIVFASGSFDILHIGHLNFLKRARGLGDKLIIGVQEDRWVRDIKHHEPYMPEQDRLRIISALSIVDDAFLVYGPEYPDELIKRGVTIRAIGEDRRLVWSESDNIKARMEAVGIGYVHLPYTQDISSTSIRERVERARGYDYFVISSSSLLSMAAAELGKLRDKGFNCFFPALHIPGTLSPKAYKAAILDAALASKKAKVFWDGVSHGPLVDLGICLGAGVEIEEFRIITMGKANIYIKELAGDGD